MVSADLVSPLPHSSAGNTMLLVMQDRCTKWMELRPLRTGTGTAIVNALREQVVMRYGCPRTLVTDNGRQFVGEELAAALREWGIQHRRTQPYTPQCNPVERVNKVIKTMISQYAGRNQRAWDQRCAEIAFAYNTAHHSSIGYSPAYVNYGREPITPGSLHQEARQSRTTTSCEQLILHLREARELASCNNARNFQQQQKYYDQHRREWIPEQGALVLKKSHVLSDKAAYRNAKLVEKYTGPFTIR